MVRHPRLWLSEGALGAIEEAARNAHPNETGGVLVGVYAEGGRPWVVEAVEVTSGRAGSTYYELPENARPEVVDRARERDGRLGYIGDWHSHPADMGASDTDITTMRGVAEEEGADCDHPVLLIAPRASDEYRMDVRELARWRLRKLRLIVAGGLPQVDRGGLAAGRVELPETSGRNRPSGASSARGLRSKRADRRRGVRQDP